MRLRADTRNRDGGLPLRVGCSGCEPSQRDAIFAVGKQSPECGARSKEAICSIAAPDGPASMRFFGRSRFGGAHLATAGSGNGP